MQPTLPSWAWASWERRARSRAGARQRLQAARDLAPPAPDLASGLALRPPDDHYAVYDVRKDTRHFIRLDRLGKTLLLSRPWAGTVAPPAWHYERYDNAPRWRDHDIMSVGSLEAVSLAVPVAASTESAAPAAALGNGSRSWAAAALVLAVLLIIVRATESCLKSSFRKHSFNFQGRVRRQESDEWCTPSVTATSRASDQPTLEVSSVPRLEERSIIGGRSPPPRYAECVPEPPPPPYATISLPHNIADTHSHSRTDFDNAQNNLIENRIATAAITPNGTVHLSRTEFVFADGRVMERVASDVNTYNKKTSGKDQQPNKDKVVYVDETATKNATDETLLV